MAVFETILGGILAGVAGAGTLWLERLGARRDYAIQLADRQSAVVFSAVIRIQQMHAWLRATMRNIDECFSSADDPQGAIDPGLKVLPMVMPANEPGPFTSDELTLAFASRDSGLVEKLLNLSANFHSYVETLREFNSLRREYAEFIQSPEVVATGWSGNQASLEMPFQMKHGHESRVVVLNQLISSLIESNEKGIEECRLILSRFCSSMRSLPNVAVPTVTFP